MHRRSLIRIHTVRLPTLLQVEIANSMDPDLTARMRRLVWIHAGRKLITLVLLWHGSYQLQVSVQFTFYAYSGYSVYHNYLDVPVMFMYSLQYMLSSYNNVFCPL
jgi:ABC-type thiamine transport system ATPase subunit